MTIRHKRIPLDEVEAGTVLSAAVVDERGNVLLPSGAELGEAVLRSLARRGIESVQVVDDSVSEAELERVREERRARLEILFRNYPAIAGRTVGEQLRCGVPDGASLLLRSVARHRLGEPA